ILAGSDQEVEHAEQQHRKKRDRHLRQELQQRIERAAQAAAVTLVSFERRNGRKQRPHRSRGRRRQLTSIGCVHRGNLGEKSSIVLRSRSRVGMRLLMTRAKRTTRSASTKTTSRARRSKRSATIRASAVSAFKWKIWMRLF